MVLYNLFVKLNISIILDLISKLINFIDDLIIIWEIGDGEKWKEINENNSIVKWNSEFFNFIK